MENTGVSGNMKICIIAPYLLPDRSGFEYYMSREFYKTGIEVVIISSDVHPFKKNIRYAIGWQDYKELKAFRIKTKLNLHQAPFVFFDKRLLKRINPDIVIAGEYFQPLSVFASKICKQFKIPFFFNQHMYLYPKGMFGFQFRLYDRTVRNFIWQNSDGAFAISRAAKNFLQGLGFKKKVEVITGGVNTEIFKPQKGNLRKLLDIDNDTYLVLCVARLSLEKGIMKIPSIAKATRDLNIHYVIVGDGPLKDKFYSSLNGLNNVDVINYIPYNEMPGIYSDANLCIAPSNIEVLNYSILEAMACGVPVLASDIGGMKDVINKYVGFLLPSGDIDAWVEKIKDFYEKGVDLDRKRIREHAKSFDWKIAAKKTMELVLE